MKQTFRIMLCTEQKYNAGRAVVYFEPITNVNCSLVAPPSTRRTAISGASHNMLGSPFCCGEAW